MSVISRLFRTGKKYKTGIILSGGGARGFAHAGILKALNESGIYPDIISGVSAGAIVGALYADGYSPDQIYEIFSQSGSFFKYVKVALPKRGFFQAKGLKENIGSNLRSKKFDELKLPLYVAATNLSRARVVYFNSGEILDKVMASAAIPILFQPVDIEGECYVDGGVMDNFPISPIVRDCHRLIGVSLNPFSLENEFANLIQIAERTFRLAASSNIEMKKAKCDLVFEPEELAKHGILDVSSGKEMFELGYQTTINQLNR